MQEQFKPSKIWETGTPAQYKDRSLSRGPQKGGCLHRKPIGGQEILSGRFGISSGLRHWRNRQGKLLWATFCSLLRVWLQASGNGFHPSLQSTGSQLDSKCYRQAFFFLVCLLQSSKVFFGTKSQCWTVSKVLVLYLQSLQARFYQEET